MDEVSHALEQLASADLVLADEVKAIVQAQGSVPTGRMALLVEETLWGLSQEIAFGTALASGGAADITAPSVCSMA